MCLASLDAVGSLAMSNESFIRMNEISRRTLLAGSLASTAVWMMPPSFAAAEDVDVRLRKGSGNGWKLRRAYLSVGPARGSCSTSMGPAFVLNDYELATIDAFHRRKCAPRN